MKMDIEYAKEEVYNMFYTKREFNKALELINKEPIVLKDYIKDLVVEDKLNIERVAEALKALRSKKFFVKLTFKILKDNEKNIYGLTNNYYLLFLTKEDLDHIDINKTKVTIFSSKEFLEKRLIGSFF
jgi:hypothetical protein